MVSKATEKIYGFLWDKESAKPAPSEGFHFNRMQEVVFQKIVNGSFGIEVGSGCGYDTLDMATNNPSVRIISMDISDGVYNTHRITTGLKNVSVIKGSALNIPLKDATCDFVYSFGVLHHLPEPSAGLKEMARVLRKKCHAFLYVYEDHADNTIKHAFLVPVSLLRKITTKLAPKMLYLVCFLFSPAVFLFFSLPSIILKKNKCCEKIAQNMPFNFGKTPFSLTMDLYDRFGAPVEHRFNRQDLYNMFRLCGFFEVNIVKLRHTAGWVAWGSKGS